MQTQIKPFEGLRSVQTRPSKTLEATRPLSRPATAGRATLKSCKALLGRDESGSNQLAAISSQDASAKRQTSCASTAMVQSLRTANSLTTCPFPWLTILLGFSGRRPSGEDACTHQRPVSLSSALTSPAAGTGVVLPDHSAALAL